MGGSEEREGKGRKGEGRRGRTGRGKEGKGEKAWRTREGKGKEGSEIDALFSSHDTHTCEFKIIHHTYTDIDICFHNR